MPDRLAPQDFSAHVGSTFRVADPAVDLELTEVQTLGEPRRGAGVREQAFSLLFSGPLRPLLPQRIYRLEHAAFEPLEIFLVPLGPDAGGQRYEAVFN